MRRTDRPPQALAAAATFLTAAVVMVLAVGAGPIEVTDPEWLSGEPGGGAGPDRSPGPAPTFGTPAPPPDRPLGGQSGSFEFPWLVSLVVLLALAALLAYVIVRKWPRTDRRRPSVLGGQVDEPLDASEELRAAARAAGAALSHTRRGMSGAQAVIEAWLALETAAAGTGTARAPAQTPSEFTAALLRRHHADATATSTLLALYHRARFSPRPHIGADDVAAADHALGEILRTIAPESGAPAREDGAP